MNRKSRKSHPWGTPPWSMDFRPARRPLPVRADFAIVGAGFTGLSAAAWLAKLAPGKTVVVLESESIGNGASGRTGGMVLADTAAGPLPGLGDALAGYRKIMRTLQIDSRLGAAWRVGTWAVKDEKEFGHFVAGLGNAGNIARSSWRDDRPGPCCLWPRSSSAKARRADRRAR